MVSNSIHAGKTAYQSELSVGPNAGPTTKWTYAKSAVGRPSGPTIHGSTVQNLLKLEPRPDAPTTLILYYIRRSLLRRSISDVSEDDDDDTSIFGVAQM